MAKPQRNEFYEVMERIVDSFRQLREDAAHGETHAIPFGNEVVRRQDVMPRLQALTPDQRKKIMADPIQRERILEVLKDATS